MQCGQDAPAGSLFPGLVLDVDALPAGDYATVFRRVVEAASQ